LFAWQLRLVREQTSLANPLFFGVDGSKSFEIEDLEQGLYYADFLGNFST
jgi:hypothetical protein